jgi:hypothetical protein
MIELFNKRFEYDKEKGWLLHKQLDESCGLTAGYIKRHNKIYAGFKATCPNSKRGHLTVTVNNKKYCAARVCWLMLYGEWPIKCVRQVNGNKADLRPENLSLVNDLPAGIYRREVFRNKGDVTYYIAAGRGFKELDDAVKFLNDWRGKYKNSY